MLWLAGMSASGCSTSSTSSKASTGRATASGITSLPRSRGLSSYRLPKVLQWFTGNIGFHHIHHLSPRIPNYRLEECHASNPIFQQEVKEIGFLDALRMVRCS